MGRRDLPGPWGVPRGLAGKGRRGGKREGSEGGSGWGDPRGKQRAVGAAGSAR